MNTVHQHIEGWIAVRTPSVTYSDTWENFAQDFGVTFPPLPEGAVERIYDQGKRHAVQSSEDVIEGGDMPWALGDQLIANVDAGVAAQSKRSPPT